MWIWDPGPSVAETMKIQVGGLSEGLHSYHFEVPPSDLELGETFNSPILVDVRVNRTGHRCRLRLPDQRQDEFAIVEI